jgi:hypothetical protein
MGDRHDPVWAVRLVKRALKVLAILALFAVLVLLAWSLLPEDPPRPELHITTDAEVFAGESSLGTGEILLDDNALRANGAAFPAGTPLADICAVLFPGEEFRGPIMVDSAELPLLPAGVECYLRGNDRRVVRLFVFEDGNNWQVVPLRFRHPERGWVYTFASQEALSSGWALGRNFRKRREDAKQATLTSVEGSFPADGTWATGPIRIR